MELPPDFTRRLETAEIEACRAYTRAASPAVARDLGIAMRALGSGVAMAASRVDVLMFNRVLGLGVGTPATAADLDDAAAFFKEAGSPRWLVQLSPLASPEVRDLLEVRGFRHHNHWIKLWRFASVPVGDPPDPRIREIGPRHAGDFARCLVEVFGMPDPLAPWLAATIGQPDWRHYAAFDGEDPVGFGALFVTGSTACLGSAATRVTHRGRGIQSALIATRLRAAAAMGCEMVVVETADDTPEKPNPSTHNLVRLGFHIAYRRPNWILDGAEVAG